MTDFEKFQQLFSECRIWRGGGSCGSDNGITPHYDFDIAVDDDTGTHKKYIQLRALFDDSGEWISTRSIPVKKRRK